MSVFERQVKALEPFVASVRPEFDLEVIITQMERAVTRLANSEIHQNVTDRDTRVIVRVVENDRAAVIEGNSLEAHVLRDQVQSAREIAQRLPPLDVNPGLSRPSKIHETKPFDPAIGRFTPARRAQWASIFVRRAREDGLTASGAITRLNGQIAYLNSNGVVRMCEASRVSVEIIFYDDSGSGFATGSALSAEALDPFALAEEAAWRATRSRNPIAVQPGEYTVLLEPPAVAEILDFMGWAGFNAKMIEDHQSFVEDTLGKKAVSVLVTVVEDPFSRENPGLPFDFEGTPRQRVILIQDGVIKSAVYDRRTAMKANKKSTGNALPPVYNVGPLPLNIVMKPGKVTRNALIQKVKKGLLVTRFHYTNIVDPRKLILTGMTRDGTFEIRNGEIARGVKNLRFTQNIVNALKQTIGVARERSLLSSWFSATLAPAILIRGFRFTSATLF